MGNTAVKGKQLHKHTSLGKHKHTSLGKHTRTRTHRNRNRNRNRNRSSRRRTRRNRYRGGTDSEALAQLKAQMKARVVKARAKQAKQTPGEVGDIPEDD